MTIAHLIEILERRVTYLSALKTSAERLGDIPALTQAEADIAETEATLAALRGL